jgi:hypothetical protein
MNEHIAQLINQATMIEDHYPEGCNGHPVPRVWFDKVKFAELIVKECSGFVYNYPDKYLTRNQAREICLSMEEHFGVEE